MRLAPLLYCSVLSLSGVLLSACGGGDSATDTNSGAQGGQSGGGGVAGKAGSGGSGSGQSGGGGSSGGGAGKAGGAGVAGSAGASGSAGAGGAGSAGKGGVSGSSGQGGSAGEAGAGAVSGSGGAGNGGSAGASAGSAGSGVVQGGSAGDSGAGGGGGGGSAGAAGAAGDAGSAGAAGDAGAAGSAGSGGCAVDNDCAAQLPATLDPPGCADALCEAGVCVLRPKDADGDGKRGKLCADTGGAVVLPGDDCDDSDSKRFPGAWDGPAGEGHEGSCDGVDNNCSGAPDDTALSDGTSCECKLGTSSSCSEDEAGNLITWPAGDPVGACSYGTKDCLPDPSTGLGKWTACFGAVSPVNEVCDGLDNDCNGAVDDGLGTVNCGVGGCGKTVDACVNGQLSECVPGEPGPEVCDGVDNDCNGLVDEDNPGGGVDCSTGKLGVCSSGVALCENGALKCIQSVEPSDEVCDGLDNNCDGKTDENNPGGGDCDTGKLGACAPGALQCVSGALFCLQKQPSTSEDCDGIDNNCDGNVDEDNPGGGVQCLTGLLGQCAVGVKQCQGGALNCVAPQPTAEICNGLDDNCDGNIDETCTACDFADINKSSIGCLYYALDANNDPVEGYDAQPYAVTVSNVDSVAVAKVKVQTRNNGVWTDIQTATVNPSSLHQFNLPDRHVNYTNLNPAGAYRVVSDSPIVAYQFQPVNGQSSFTSDASLLLPRSALDTSYIVAGWGKPSFGNAQMVVIATEDNTSVTVTPTTPIIAGGSIPAINANTPYTRSLNAGDYMQLESSTGSFSGTTVKSTKPVSVFSNHWCANIPTQVCCCDHLEEQIFGLQTWGKTYVASRHPRRNTSGGAEAVLWQVVASEDNTTVSFAATAGVTGLPAGPQVLNKGQTLQLLVGGPSATNPGDFIATGDKPILVVQYMTSSQNSNAPVAQAGDPFMVQAVPSEQYLDNYVVLTPSQWNLDYLILTKPVGSSITVDGVAVPQAQFSPVGNSTWEVARVLSSDGVHRLKGTAPFGVLVVGYDSYDSYGYPGGLNQLVINPQQ